MGMDHTRLRAMSQRALATLGALGTMVLASCAQEAPSGDAATSVALINEVSTDPEGAALPLSIGGRVEAEAGDAFSTAVNCAAALSITADRLATVTENPLSNEIALINRAEGFFVDEAEEAAAEGEGAAGSVEANVARRREEKASEITTQAQLAIACLRRFGDSLDPLTGLPT